MKYNVGLENVKNGLEAVLVFENEKVENPVFNKMNELGLFSGKEGEVVIYRDLEDKEKVALVGLGKKEDICINKVRKIFYNVAKEMQAKKEEEIKVFIPKLNELCTRRTYAAALEGFIHAEYKFDRYKSEKFNNKEITVNFFVTPEKEEKVKKGLEKIANTMEGVFFTRDLVNMPSQDLYPETLANFAKEKLEEVGVKVTVYEEDEIEKIGMKAFLSVARGSSNRPRLIVMEYLNDADSSEKIALVGKGVTYDTGGYSIKPSEGMKTMFCDMGGAGTVIGTMYALAKNNVKTNVYAVVAACENSISGNAYKPGDVIGSLAGKSIEVDNTDAEGRLTLADAVYYSSTVLKVDKIIDLATLTGACLVALNEFYTGSVTNNQELFNEVLEASKKAGEHIWQLPTSDEFRALNNSRVADIKNSGGRMGGTISAGLFIEAFVNKTPWVHLDIAGTAFLSKEYSYLPLGATGVHVKTLVEMLDKPCGCKN
ncbi:leucyl aminopeptidase [Streptobacillus felis]|uniref:leucyl aminopeptidase n=1 Tax=Streptobacillus felis TaxID=1384509 RepID=UPI000837771F|nr:leucyl aminopeptidase [Streptobacillus felis]